MATTSIFVELLVAGCFSLSWLVLFCLRFSILDVAILRSLFAFDDAKSAIFVGLGIVIAYQVGMMVNLLAYGILYIVREKAWQLRAARPRGKFEEMRAVVFQRGSDQVLQDLLVHLNFTRMGRTGMFNFTLLAIALIVYDRGMWGLAVLSLGFAMGSVPIWLMQGSRYYRRMGIVFKVIANEHPLLLVATDSERQVGGEKGRKLRRKDA
jgi:hypothetical protein